jgi:predicted alpha/beta-fold hydrolase
MFQSIYELLSPGIDVEYEREKIFFVDGGHVSLDWVNKFESEEGRENVPVLLVMHGMTGGSECKYIKVIAKMAQERGYTCLCLNSRGFNSEMTSPVPFIGLHHHELEATLQRLKTYFPRRPLHLIGLSLGGNYLMRFLLQNPSHPLISTLASLSLVGAPFDVGYVISNMNSSYQRYFIKFYINKVVCRHKQMSFWWRTGVVDEDHMRASRDLRQFHERMTEPLMGEPLDSVFDRFKVTEGHVAQFAVKTLMIAAQDDPMVKIESIPLEAVRRNANIKLILTENGGHMCWFEGVRPSRWYPRAIFQFIEDTKRGKNVSDMV